MEPSLNHVEVDLALGRRESNSANHTKSGRAYLLLMDISLVSALGWSFESVGKRSWRACQGEIDVTRIVRLCLSDSLAEQH